MRYAVFMMLLMLSLIARADDGIAIIGDSTLKGAVPYIQAAMPCAHRVGGNARDSGHLLTKLGAWLAGKQYRIIYFNVGLWDVARRAPTPDDIWNLDPTDTADVSVGINHYGVNLQHIAENIRAAQPGAIVIFATSTDVPANSIGRLPGDLDNYNARSFVSMANQHVPVDDRHAFMMPYAYLHTLNNQNKVHYVAAGYQVMASHIVDVLQSYGGC